MKEYVKKLYATRYFWLQLARSDLKNRFRRSKLGILWSMLNPLLLTLLIATIFGTIFNSPLDEYAPYILSGLIVWDVISASFIAGGNALLSCEQYIRQVSYPMTIYSLKWAIVTIVTFFIAAMSLCLWILFQTPSNVPLGLVTLPLTAVIYLVMSWAITTIAALTNTKYRDYPQIAALILQGIWYLSPVFFKREMFESNPALATFFDYNPIAHVLELVRAPFLYGHLPTLQNYLFSLAFVLLLVLIAAILSKRYRTNIIYYI